MRTLILIAALLGFSFPAAAAMVIDVSDETISVTTGFNGTALTVFGMQEEPGAVVVVVEGPPKEITVRKKDKVMGLWTNTDSHIFENIPAYYEVAAASPLDIIADQAVLRSKRIGMHNLPIVSTGNADPASAVFIKALFENQVKRNVFVRDVVPLRYPGPMMFKAKFNMPALVASGKYRVSAYLFQDGQVIDEAHIPFVIVPEGMSANIRRFATEDGLLYGLSGILLAVFAGWMATVLLKRE